jgi:hypothetical protein
MRLHNLLTRDFYIPRESYGRTNIATVTEGDAVVYTYTTANGKPGAMAFHGKAAKPDWNFAFAHADQRAKKIAEFFASRKEWANYKAKNRAEKQKPHTLKVGDILVSSWGYDQTNIDYYQVTRVVGPNSVEICQIKAKSGPEEGFILHRVQGQLCRQANDQAGQLNQQRQNRVLRLRFTLGW